VVCFVCFVCCGVGARVGGVGGLFPSVVSIRECDVTAGGVTSAPGGDQGGLEDPRTLYFVFFGRLFGKLCILQITLSLAPVPKLKYSS